MIKIVIVDDHQLFLDGLVSVLTNEENIEILFVENKATEALKKMAMVYLIYLLSLHYERYHFSTNIRIKFS